MSRPKGVIAALVALLVVAGAVAIYRRRPTGPPAQISLAADSPTPPKRSGPTPLPDFFESPGLVSRRTGPLRLYVTVKSEVTIRKTDAKGATNSAGNDILARVPILVVFENDSYQKLDAGRDLALTGADLFTVEILREGTSRQEVFSYREPISDLTGWEPAERKTFTVSWPTIGVAPGDYVISVKPAFGKQEKLEIHTILK